MLNEVLGLFIEGTPSSQHMEFFLRCRCGRYGMSFCMICRLISKRYAGTQPPTDGAISTYKLFYV